MRSNIFIRIVFFIVALTSTLLDGWTQQKANVKLQFTRLNTLNGLSQSTINAIVKDRTGFMWFGTSDGLNRYDGYSFKVYRNVPANSGSLPYNLISALFVDSKGRLWVGTLGGGLARYDERTDSFQSYQIGLIQRISEDSMGRILVGTFDGLFMLSTSGKMVRAETLDKRYRVLRGKKVTAILQDKKQNLWVGTTTGLYLFSLNSEKVSVFFASEKAGECHECEIGDILLDQKGTIWVGTKGALYRYDIKNGSFSAAQFLIDNKLKNVQGIINALSCDMDNTIWVATENGLGRYDSDARQYSVMTNDAFNAQSLSRNSVNSLYADPRMLWVGTALGGLNIYERDNSLISHYKIYNPSNQKANTNVVTSFARQSANKFFIGTDGGGLFSWNEDTNIFEEVDLSRVTGKNLGQSILCLQRSRNGEKLWVGTYNDGLFELNLKTNAITRFHTGNNILINDAVYSVLEDQKSNLWIGTNGGGVTVISPQGKVILQLNRKGPGTLKNDFIRALIQDERGRIWIGTYAGVNIFDPRQHKFASLDPQAQELGRHLVYSFFYDAYDKMWVGTQGAGLFIYDTRHRKLTRLTEKQGLSNDNVSSIISQGRFVWISTSRGLNMLIEKNPLADQLQHGQKLQESEFTNGAGFSCANGDLLFGSVDGFDLVHYYRSKKKTSVPPLIITDFQIAGISRSSSPKQIAQVSIVDGEVQLENFHSAFTIEFASLNYLSNGKNTYACKLEGLEQDWQYLGEDHKVTYHNLSPGKYVFQVRAVNKDRVVNDHVTSLRITVLPPWWRTPLAYILYSVAAFFILYFLYRELKARGRLKRDLIMEKMNAEKTRELNLLKMNFFTNVSHELRTPLSLIIDPLRKISENEPTHQQAKSLSETAFRHASRLLTLVNQLLDFRKMQEAGHLEKVPTEIQAFIHEIIIGFKDRANMRNLDLSEHFFLDFPLANIDVDKFQKVITNLVANAFNFTPDGGKISLITRTFIDNNQIRQLSISISDTGPGIPEIYKNKIFEMFFQVNQAKRFDIASSGIGLALVKELIELHGGEIHEEGVPGEGAKFVVEMPAGEAAITEMKPAAVQVNDDYLQGAPVAITEDELADEEQYSILIVDDNEDLRSYIKSNLSEHYRIEVAASGHEGYQKALESIPDLILSDIMMRDGDGLELCEKIKNNEKTSHIPVILLTARDTDESKMEGYQSGADAYISKPFNSDLLLIRIRKMLESRQKLRHLHHTVHAQDLPPDQRLSELDEEFLRKAEQVILNNLTENGFDVPEFASMLDMSRMQLSRKLKAIKDQTPHEFIIRIRLATAIDLMLHKDFNISQAAYQVGFAEPANFSRSFTKVYGQSPKSYMCDKHGKGAF